MYKNKNKCCAYKAPAANDAAVFANLNELL